MVVFAIALSLAQSQPKAEDLGAAPTWEQAVTIGEKALRNQLIDPQSAQIEWPYNFTGGSIKALLGKRRFGYYTCGWVNAKNRMGGYTGRVPFLIMIRDGVVTEVAVGSFDGIDTATVTCASMIKKGLLEPAPASVPTSANATANAPSPWTAPPSYTPPPEMLQAAAQESARKSHSNGGVGIAFQPTQFGAMVLAVAPGSPAEKAGLKPGAVIESINGVSLAGLQSADMIRLIQSVKSREVLVGVVGVGEKKLTRD